VRCGRTLGLMVGVGVLSLLIGTGTAWLVTMYRFPGRSVLQWLLLLPLAVPTYIIAHSYLELLDYSGIVQTSLRELFGWQNARSLAHDALVHLATGLASEFWDAALNSLLLAVSAAILAISFALVLAYARRQTRSQLIQAASTLPAISYAVPGTVLAIGLLIPLAGLDNGIDGLMRWLFELSTGLLLSGTAFAIVLAYTIRFLAASLSAIEAGSSKISRNIDAAARTLGSSVSELLFKVHLPMPRPALGAAALLVFVDSMKELPATLLLRPFNFDTLANPGLALPLRGSGIVSAHHRVWSAWRQSYSCMVSSREAVREPG
jgi:ABC-type Fe3+ transport system permease subunit